MTRPLEAGCHDNIDVILCTKVGASVLTEPHNNNGGFIFVSLYAEVAGYIHCFIKPKLNGVHKTSNQ